MVPDDESVALSTLAREEGLESAADLGYLFASAAEAREAGVAASWLRARQAATLPAAELRRLVLQAAANAGGRGAGNDRSAPSPRHVGPPKPVFLPTAPSAPAAVRGPRPRTSPQCAEAADQVARRRAALEVARLSAGWRPGLSPEQRALVASKNGPVAIRLAAFEPACLRGALRAWASWCAWCAKRGLGDDPAAIARCPVAVDTFVLGHRTARSSARAIWSRLHWLRKHAHAPFVLEAPPPVADPATGEVPPPSAQAVVLEPEMFFWAEDLLRRRVQEDAPLRLASAAVLAMVFGCVRYTHLLRSRPLERCECAAWFRCFRGKQGRPGARAAFDWALPRGPAADLIWQEWHAQAAKRAAAGGPVSAGLVFDPRSGAPVSLGLFNKWLKGELAVALPDVGQHDLLSSYSLRRFMPTLASAAGIGWEERVIGGNWTQPGEQGRNRMPIRYNGQRREVEMAVRLFTRDVLEEARVAHTKEAPMRWEDFRAWARLPPGLQKCAELTAAATRTIAAVASWSQAEHLPPSIKEELRRRRFRFVRRAPAGPREPAAVAAPAAGAPAVPPAPQQGGRSQRRPQQRSPALFEAKEGSSDGELAAATPRQGMASPQPKRRRVQTVRGEGGNAGGGHPRASAPPGSTGAAQRPCRTGEGDTVTPPPSQGSGEAGRPHPATPPRPRRSGTLEPPDSGPSPCGPGGTPIARSASPGHRGGAGALPRALQGHCTVASPPPLRRRYTRAVEAGAGRRRARVHGQRRSGAALDSASLP